MPLKVVLQNIRNVARGQVIPSGGLLERIPPFNDESFPLLQFIDEYGNTVFNGLQMRQFIKEWELIMSRAETEEEIDCLLHVRYLAEECQNHPHLFLRFIGD
jgi:hypothetical protein